MKKLLTFASLLTLLSLGLQGAPGSRRPRLGLNRAIDGYTLKADNFLDALTEVAAEYGIPMGIEWTKTSAAMKPINLQWQETTPSNIITTLVGTQPGYLWDEMDGVVHVFPANSPTDKLDFLNLNVDSFEVENDYVQFASTRLQQRLRWIVNPSPSSASGAGEAGSMATGQGDRKVSLKLTRTTVRDILDKLALAADFKVWVVTWPEAPSFTQKGFRRVSYPAKDMLPEEAQPSWELLIWGQDPFTFALASQRHPETNP